ncbi:hypothetical protein AVEN_142252-1 [Araneus ventricosus]|uniref:Uncharacterized protein n=1 Tax=Araneus ventricosus TaxID=182803 RepID=A0A4Y2FFH8_ARAVE|nr:hypothetical protein AVEN_142252-1 [Araneus ventricosus]
MHSSFHTIEAPHLESFLGRNRRTGVESLESSPCEVFWGFSASCSSSISVRTDLQGLWLKGPDSSSGRALHHGPVRAVPDNEIRAELSPVSVFRANRLTVRVGCVPVGRSVFGRRKMGGTVFRAKSNGGERV